MKADDLREDLSGGHSEGPPSTPSRLDRECSFNINHHVRVKLTPTGRAHLEKIGEMWRLTPGHSNAVDDATGYSDWQLWDLMATFGPMIHHGGAVPFETEIVLRPDVWPLP
jgi:hypothetical protein